MKHTDKNEAEPLVLVRARKPIAKPGKALVFASLLNLSWLHKISSLS